MQSYHMILDIMPIVLNFLCGYVCEGEGRDNRYFGTAVRYYGVLLEYELNLKHQWCCYKRHECVGYIFARQER